MIDFDTKVAIEDTVKTMLGDTIKHKKATEAAIAEDGTVIPDAVRNAIPWVPHNGVIAGPLATGNNVLRWPFPQSSVIRRVSIDALTPPSGGALTFTLVGGETSQSFSLPDGQSTLSGSAHIVALAGAWIRLNVVAASGAADVVVTLHFSQGA